VQIKILYDNKAFNESFFSGWGFSCLADGHVLFDCGEKAEPLFSNMKAFRVFCEAIDTVVISHDHWDHIGALEEILKRRKGIKVFGLSSFSDKLKRTVKRSGSEFVEVGAVQRICENVFSTGPLKGKHKGQEISEHALALRAKTGLVLVTGCAHPGVVAFAETAAKAFPSEVFSLLMGGFHLLGYDEESLRCIQEKLCAAGLKRIAPAHCTGNPAMNFFKKSFSDNFVDISAGVVLDV